MTSLIPLLLLSLPLLPLLGLSDAAPFVGLSNTTTKGPTTLTVPATTLGPLGECMNFKSSKLEHCTAAKPICLLSYEVNEQELYNPDFILKPDLRGCVDSNLRDGCIKTGSDTTRYDCFCDSRSEESCSSNLKIQKRFQAVAVALYQKANPTTPPTTTTPDPNHRCLKGEAPPVACPGPYFCHTKFSYDPHSFRTINGTGIGCVEKLPEKMLNDTCRMIEPFDISAPIFECFCPSEVGHACNAPEENKLRKETWEKLIGETMRKVEDEQKENEKKKATEELEKRLVEEKEKKEKFPYAAIIPGPVLLLILLFGLGAAVFYYRKVKLDRELRKIARETLQTVLSKCDPRALVDRWLDFDKSKSRNVPASQLIPNGGPKKVLGAFSDVPLIAATAVDTQLPGEEQIHWNFADEEQLFIAAQCPSKETLGAFFLSLVHADVRCVMQLTQRAEIVEGSPCDYLELKKYALPQMKVGNATVDVRVVDVEDKKSYAYRKMIIKLKGDEAGKSGTHVFHHFHYHDWTDHDIPTERADIFDVAFRVYKMATHVDGRLLVHCRGGIGRTGAFLLVQMLLKLAFQKVELTTDSVFALAKSIRHRRHGAIQEPSQLAFALFVVAGVHMQAADATREDSLDVKEFSKNCDQVINNESAKEDERRRQLKANRDAKEKRKAEKKKKKEEAAGGEGEKN